MTVPGRLLAPGPSPEVTEPAARLAASVDGETEDDVKPCETREEAVLAAIETINAVPMTERVTDAHVWAFAPGVKPEGWGWSVTSQKMFGSRAEMDGPDNENARQRIKLQLLQRDGNGHGS